MNEKHEQHTAVQHASSHEHSTAFKKNKIRSNGLLSDYTQWNEYNQQTVAGPGSSDQVTGLDQWNFPPSFKPDEAPPATERPNHYFQGSTTRSEIVSQWSIEDKAHRPLYIKQHPVFTMVKHWTGKMAAISTKMAAITGHTIQPPAPYMERYHPPVTIKTTEAGPQNERKPWKRSRTIRIALLMHQRRIRWKKTQFNPGRLALFLMAIVSLFCLVITLVSGFYGYLFYQNQLPKLQQLAHQKISQTTRIYDRNFVTLYEVFDNRNGGGRRTPVTYDNIPQIMRDSMTTAEDHSFWTNTGIDPQGILRSLVGLVQHQAIQGGGSTITQQVIKNLSGDNEVSFNRKVPEAALAIGLTRQYPKWKILEMYFNVAPFGSQDLGVEAAVEEYFHLQPHCDTNFKCIPGIAQLDLNLQNQQHDPLLALARASFLAGMPQKPVTDNPTIDNEHKERALKRQAEVLGEMINLHINVAGLGEITPAMANQAVNLMRGTTFTPYNRVKKAPHFVDWIINKVEIALGNGDANKGYVPFITGGYNIRTTIDVQLEDYVERAVQRHIREPELQMYTYDSGPLNTVHNVNDAAVVVMNAHTGELLAMNGSADYNSSDPRIGGQFTVADPTPDAQGLPPGRGPGSTFKPIIYATAFSMGWYPGMVLPDFKTYFPNSNSAGTSLSKLYAPPDYSRDGSSEYHHNSNSTIREATANSYNVPAMMAMQFAGPENVLNMARRMGITTVKNDGIAWGLGSQNVPLIQMVGAYQVFANAGMRVLPQGVLDIWDNYGHNLYHYDVTHPAMIQVISPQVAFLMTSVLIDEPARALEFPGDHDLSFADHDRSCIANPLCEHQVAAKTGTTDQYTDNLTIGYTPNIVVGVWAGNADNSPMQNVTGITGAAPIWHSVMEFAAMGWCNEARDLISCPTTQRDTWNISEQTTFPIPAGVHKATVSAQNGLLGSGVTDWIIDGEEPLQEGQQPKPIFPSDTDDDGSQSTMPMPSAQATQAAP